MTLAANRDNRPGEPSLQVAARLYRGFSLIEMAIVLVVIGLLLGGGILAVAPVLESTNRSETDGKLDRIGDALTLYVIQNGCLPCPADGDLAIGTAGAGQSQTDNGGGAVVFYTSGCADEAGGSGASCRVLTSSITEPDDVVPWETLGMSEADAVDAWGNRIRYSLTRGLSQASSMVRSGSSYPAGTVDISDAGSTVSAITTEAAYVLVSHGPDGSNARAAQTGATRADKYNSPNQQENSIDVDDDFIQDNPIDVEDTTYFDDIVRWRSAPMVISDCGSGNCGNP